MPVRSPKADALKQRRNEATVNEPLRTPHQLGPYRLLQVFLALIIALSACIAHFPAIYARYTWDDDVFLRKCELVTASDGIYKSWFTMEGTDYWPLMTTMFWFEWRIWGDNPMPFHAANIVLHALAAVLLWRVLLRLNVNRPGAFLAALIFAVHPATVESVAWIAERKNVLSIAFFFIAILAYLRFEDSGRKHWYAAAWLIALAAILAKSSAVVLPVVLLLLAWWRRDKLSRKDLLACIPFFVVSLVLGLVEMQFVQNQISDGETGRPEGIASRIAAVGWIVWFYLYKIFVPIHLAMIYPRWNVDAAAFGSYLPLLALLALLAILWLYRRTWGRARLVVLAYFLIVILPVAGVLNMQFNRYSLVADHLQYLAMPAIIALFAGFVGAVWQRARQNRKQVASAGLASFAGLTVLACGILTWRQATVYQDEVALWTQTIELNNQCWAAYNHRGLAYNQKGDYERALKDYTTAIELKPNFSIAYANRAGTHGNMGQYDLQIQDCNTALSLHPEAAEAFYYRGFAYSKKKMYDQAVQDFSRAIEPKPQAESFSTRANCYSQMGDFDRAIVDFTKAIELKPTYAKAFNNRGNGYAQKQQYAKALQDFNRAIELKPDNAEAYFNRAVAFFALGDYTQAWANVEQHKNVGGKPNPAFIKALSSASGRMEGK